MVSKTFLMIGDKIIEIAAAEIGTVESPENSNKTKYGKWFGLDGEAWCGIFASWVYFNAGIPIKKAGYAKGYAGCSYALSHVKDWGVIISKPEKGCVIFYDWNNDSRPDHTGLFEKDNGDGKTFTAIEGNTAHGNDSNGGKVMRRDDRKYSQAIFVRPNVYKN